MTQPEPLPQYPKQIETATGHEITNDSYQIWHVNDLFRVVKDPQWPADYTHVATLEADSFEDAFEKSNSHTCSWYDAESVSICKAFPDRDPWGHFINGGLRSTSVNDVIRDFSGSAQRVLGSGFETAFDKAMVRGIRKAHWGANPVIRDEAYWENMSEAEAIEAIHKPRLVTLTTRETGRYLDTTDCIPEVVTIVDANGQFKLDVDYLNFCALVDYRLITWSNIPIANRAESPWVVARIGLAGWQPSRARCIKTGRFISWVQAAMTAAPVLLYSTTTNRLSTFLDRRN